MDAAALLDSMEPLLRASTGMHTRLRLEIAQRPLAFRGDQTQIEQVILNLVQNAVDAMGDHLLDQRRLGLDLGLRGFHPFSLRVVVVVDGVLEFLNHPVVHAGDLLLTQTLLRH